MVEPQAVVQTAMNALLWCAAVMTIAIGCVDLRWGDNDPKDLGIVLLSGALLETVFLAFVISKGAVLDATIATAFILVLWYLGAGFVLGGTNHMVMTHGNMLTGLLFLGLAIWAGVGLGQVFLTVALVLLVPVLWCGGLAAYLQKPAYAKIGGLCSFVDAFVFAFMAFSGAIGVVLP